MPPLTPVRLLTTWAPGPLLLLPLGLLLAYALLLPRRGRSAAGAWCWPWRRTASVVASTLVLAWAVAGAPAAYRASLSWAGALSVGLTSAVVPLGLALGDPVRLWEESRGRPVAWVRGRVARVLTFPLLASALSAAVVTAAFATGWYTSARTDLAPWAALHGAALLTGVLVTLPLLGDGLLPAWAGPGLRTTFAFADGLLDAVPGLVVLAAGDSATGQTLLAVAESVGLPLLLVVLLQWVRADEADARAVDARLDRAARVDRVDPVDPVDRGDPGAGPAVATGDGDRPWWESDPRFAGRYRRPER